MNNNLLMQTAGSNPNTADLRMEKRAIAHILCGGSPASWSALDPDCFTSPALRLIYEAANRIADQGRTPDLLAVFKELDPDNPTLHKLAGQGGPSSNLADYLAGLAIDGEMFPVEAAGAISRLLELRDTRNAKNALKQAYKSLEDGKDASETGEALIDELKRISGGAGAGMINARRVDLTADVPGGKPLIVRGEDTIVQLGDLILVSGLAKSGKTAILSPLEAAALGGDPRDCLGFELAEDFGPVRVEHFDTEQHPNQAQRVGRRIQRLAGKPERENNPNFFMYALRGESPDNQRKFCIQAMRQDRPSLIVIDGVADLIEDFNDVKESNAIVAKLMAMALELNAAIVCVLHLNPTNSDKRPNDGGKARGHLGTILYNKCGMEITIKASDTTSDCLRGVRFRHSRWAKPEDFAFTIGADGVPTLATPQPVSLKNLDNLKAAFVSVLNVGETVSYTPLVNKLVAHLGIKDRTAKDKIAKALKAGILNKTENGFYHLPSLEIFDRTENDESQDGWL